MLSIVRGVFVYLPSSTIYLGFMLMLMLILGQGSPATLAEFTLSATATIMTMNEQLTFYDISLVDGYNLPLGIVSLHAESDDPNLANIPSNTTNPVCIGSADFVNDSTGKREEISHWCPWPLQMRAPPKPGAGVYPYPDDNIPRPAFDPCISSCAKYGNPADCCSGEDFDSPETCRPGLYSRRAKSVCPDAYSYGNPPNLTLALPLVIK